MKPLYIFRHIDCEGPGYLADVLDHYHIPSQLIAIDAGDPVPSDTSGCSGLILMGGSMSVNDPLPWIEQEIDLIREARDRDLPVLGHCLGGQLISKAMGGTVTKNKVQEIGWHTVNRSQNAAAGKWLVNLPDKINVFHWHGEIFSIPENAEIILENANCPHQAFVSGKTLALQCHIEMTESMVGEWAKLYEDELTSDSKTVQTAEQMNLNLPENISDLKIVADTLYQYWLEPLLDS